MKFTLFVLVLVLATCCAQSNNAFWGNLGDNDTYVYNVPIIRPSIIWLEFSQTVNYPPFVCVRVQRTRSHWQNSD